MDSQVRVEDAVGDRERFEYEKQIKDREIRLKEKEDERAEAARAYALTKDSAENGTKAWFGKVLAGSIPLIAVLVTSYFAYRQFVQTQKDTADAQARAALYSAATEQYQVVLEAKKGLILRKDAALDKINGNITTIQRLIDGTDFTKKTEYLKARSDFYVIESSVMPVVGTPELNAAISLFEDGFVRSQIIVLKHNVPDTFDDLNARWKTLERGGNAQRSVPDLPRGYADMMGYLATGVSQVVGTLHIKNADPDQFGTVKELFDKISGSSIIQQ